jgi:hypothetical protein
MYKVEIDISVWGFEDDEKLVIHTTDFEKAQIIQEFVAFQQEHGWAVDYEAVSYEDEDEDDDYVYDEDTDAWYWYDGEIDTWYVYDEESADWIEYVEDEEEEEEEEDGSEEEDEFSTTTTYVITKIDE